MSMHKDEITAVLCVIVAFVVIIGALVALVNLPDAAAETHHIHQPNPVRNLVLPRMK